MNISQFNDSEAQFIASEIILKRLDTLSQNTKKELIYPKKINEILNEIKNLETTWVYNLDDQSHSLGRKEQHEKIRLWSAPSLTAKVLAYLVLFTNSKNILEIGTSAGYSTIHLANAVKETGGKVHTIEILDEKIKLARHYFKTSGFSDQIDVINMEASEAIMQFKEKIDFVFLDADKENYGKYFELLIPQMNKGGIIVADNINDYGHLMQDYLQKVSGTHLPLSRCDPRVVSTYIAQLDNGLMITKKL